MYAAEHLYLTWGGQIGSDGAGVDIWQTGLRLGYATGATTPVLPGVGDLTTLWTGTLVPFHTNINIGISQGAILKWVKVALLDRSGSYIVDAETYEGTPTAGPVTTDRGGVQDSLVLSLWSGGTLGQANYGRMYLPWNGIPVRHQDGRISSGAAGNAATDGAAFIGDVNTWAATASAAGVETLIMSKVGTGFRKAPVYVRVGDVMDTQRRRRNRIDETYSTVAV